MNHCLYVRTVCMILFFFCSYSSEGQGATQALFLTKLRAANATSNLNYQYTMTLKESTSGRLVDSISGTMTAFGGEYIDHNNLQTTARVGDLFLQIDPEKKTVIVGKVSRFKSKTGVKPEISQPRTLFSIPDSLLESRGVCRIDSSDASNISLNFRFAEGDVSELSVVFSRSDYRIIRMQIESNEKVDGFYQAPTRYRKSLSMYHFMDVQSISCPNVVTITGGKVSLSSTYSGYKLITLTQF